MSLVVLGVVALGSVDVSADLWLSCPNPISAWTGTMGDTVFTRGVDVAANGDVVLCGMFGDGADLDPTKGVDQRHAIAGTLDMYVAKIHADGPYAWAYTVGSAATTNEASGVAIDPFGRIVVAGTFGDTVDFDPTEGIDEHTSEGAYSGFVTWLGSDGTYLSTITWGGSGHLQVGGVAVDGTGHVLVVGWFYDEIDFDPGPGVDWRSGRGDIFISKFAADGTREWTHTFYSPGFDSGRHVTVDSENNIYATGTFRGTVDFDPSDGQDEHTAVAPYEDIFVSKFHPDGSYGWTRTYNASYRALDDVLGVTPGGGCILTGTFDGTVDFDPTEGVDQRTAMPGPIPMPTTIFS
jgi:hypothetical protein